MNKKIIMTAVIALIVGLASGYLLLPQPIQEEGMNGVGAKQERKPLFYRNPMNPAITSPVPAKDEMGMDYIPVYEGSNASSPAGTVSIDPTVVQNIGVRTAIATRKSISRDIRTVGRITFDEERVARLHPKVEGWVEKLFVPKTGEQVKKGSMLLAIYSPQLVASGEEYLLALKNWESLKDSPFEDIRNGARQLLDTSLERLKFLDVPEHQLRQIRETGRVPKALHIHSPFDGIVMKIGAREGSRITPETELYMVADLSHVWVQADLYEDELPWVQPGDVAEMQLPSAPGRTFKGKVSYIYPYLEGETRTNKVRIEFANPDLLLKPDMFANITVRASRRVDAVVIPAEAVVRTGQRDQVFVQSEPGRFEPRDVKLGLSAEGEVQILDGVKEGEAVVTSSQFLIDSESKLKEATAKMVESGSQESAADSDMDMEGMSLDTMPQPAPQPEMPMEHNHDHH